MKKYLILGITLVIVLLLLAEFTPMVYDATSAVADNTSYPTMIQLIFGLAEWVPIVLLMVAVITGGIMVGRRGGRRRRR